MLGRYDVTTPSMGWVSVNEMPPLEDAEPWLPGGRNTQGMFPGSGEGQGRRVRVPWLRVRSGLPVQCRT